MAACRRFKMASLRELTEIIDNETLLRDSFVLKKKLRGIVGHRDEPGFREQLDLFAVEAEDARNRYLKRKESLPKMIYPEPDLPILEHKDEIIEAIKKNRVIILAGETGSGKTTQIPKLCIEAGRGTRGMIGHTQPRRIAARSVAQRISDELGLRLGEQVGFKVRFSDHTAAGTVIKLMTDGVLLSEMLRDKMLDDYDTIIIDEAHERSLNIDFLLGCLKRLSQRRPELRIIITSATIDPKRFSDFFGRCPIIEVSGRTYPVEVRYEPLMTEIAGEDGKPEIITRDQESAILDAVKELAAIDTGDILVFLSGEREINDTADFLKGAKLRDTEILPLYARLSADEQNRIFRPHAGRRIVLSTNVAETSLTVPGIKYVIDPGFVRISRYSARTKVQNLPIEPVSQASANQRKGRCGRTCPGICIRLYSEEDFNSRPAFTDPEILRTNLASVILQMSIMRLGSIETFPFIDAPNSRQVSDGNRLLEELQAVSGRVKLQDGSSVPRITRLGHQIAMLPVDPRLARIIVSGAELGALSELIIIVSALSVQDPRERPLNRQEAADEKHSRFKDERSDFMSILNLWNYLKKIQGELSRSQFSRTLKREFISYMRAREWQDLCSQLSDAAESLGLKANEKPADYISIHMALASGYLDHLGKLSVDGADYQGARNSRFVISKVSSLRKKHPKWVLAAELVETTRLFARNVADIQVEWIEKVAGHVLKDSYSEPHWSKKSGAVMAYLRRTLYGLPIVEKRPVNYSKIDPKLCHELFIRSALVEADCDFRYPFFLQNQELVREIESEEDKARRRDIMVDDELLFQFYSERIPEDVISAVTFDSWWKEKSRTEPDLLNYEKNFLISDSSKLVDKDDYPDRMKIGRFYLKLTYEFSPSEDDDGVTVHVPLAVLNQLHEHDFDFIVPGFRKDFFIAVIKSLPKHIRKSFIPAPDYADRLIGEIPPDTKTLWSDIIAVLTKCSGIPLKKEDFDIGSIPKHLRFNFRVTDTGGVPLAEGRDLPQIQEKLKDRMRDVLDSHMYESAGPDDEKSETYRDWSFGELKKVVRKKKNGMEIVAYPALQDLGKGIAIRLCENESIQAEVNRSGLRRLIMLNIESTARYVKDRLSNTARLAFCGANICSAAELVDDCIACAVDSLAADSGMPRNRDDFSSLLEKVRGSIADEVKKIADTVSEILVLYNKVQKQFKGALQLELALSYSEEQKHLSSLVHKGFATEFGSGQLGNIKRYLRCSAARLEKLPRNPQKDRASMSLIESVSEDYANFLKAFPTGLIPAEAEEIRWMIEEYRISLFDQGQKTLYSVSDKRIRKKMEEIREKSLLSK